MGLPATNIAETSSPANEGVAIDLSTTDFVATATQKAARGGVFVYVGVAGDVKVDLALGGAGITFTALTNGFAPILVSKVYKTGTLATNLTAVW